MGLRSKLFALTYDSFMAGGEKAGLAVTRSNLLADATGDVLEVGAGTGLNLSYYPMSVRSLTLTEPDLAMLRRLERSIASAHRPGRVLRAPAEDLPFDDATFDTVVSTLVLCGVDDQPRTVREIRRVLKPRWPVPVHRARAIRRRQARPPPGPNQLVQPADHGLRLQSPHAADPATGRPRR